MEVEELYDYMSKKEKGLAKDEPYWDKLWDQHVKESSGYYGSLPTKEAITSIMSEQNYRHNHDFQSCGDKDIWVRTGDICYIDYGKCYVNETGFQHFGVVMKIKNNKAFVVPMTSNEKAYKEALRHEAKENERCHLMSIGQVEGMSKHSVLFLNDAKFINTARIIDVKAHIPVNSALFVKIQMRLIKILL